MPEPTNVLLVISDQHLATVLGHEGHPQVITPNMDRLAAEGMRFNNAYTQSPICTPSRMSLFSGQYCHNHGYYGLSGPRPAALPSFLGNLRSHGVRTAIIGKVHTPDDPRNWLEHDVDEFLHDEASIDGGWHDTSFYRRLRDKGLEEVEDIAYFHQHMEYYIEGQPSKLPFELSQEGWCATEAMRLMDEWRNQRFCIVVSLHRPHQPFTPDRRFWDMYEEDLDLPPTINQDPSHRPPHFQGAYNWFHSVNWPIEPSTFEAGARRLWRGYLGCITHVDHALGELLDFLDRIGLAQHTAVAYTSDHGGYSGTHGIGEKAPGICSEAVCRVPLIWRAPGISTPGSKCEQLVEHVDFAPTISALLGAPEMETADGNDISALLAGSTDPVRNVSVTENPWSKAVRFDDWRLVHYQPEMFEGDVGELYNVRLDPDEANNLYAIPEYRTVVEQGRRLLLEWLIRTTRVRTCWPPVVDASREPFDYATAGDGHEGNSAGPALRNRRGQLPYL